MIDETARPSGFRTLRTQAALGALALLATGCVARHPAPRATPSPRPVAVTAKLDLEPLDLSPDGEARLLVRLRYRDARGEPVHVPPGGHVDVFADRGGVQWQPRAQYAGDPAAIVRLTEAGPLALRVTSDLPRLPSTMSAQTDTRAWRLPAVTARPLGAHTVAIGWFPRVHDGAVRIERVDAQGARRTVADVPAPASSFRDTSVVPGAHYTYTVARPGADPIVAGVDMPPELPASGIDVMRGKAMWLSFDDVSRWNVDAMLQRAQTAGIRAIELRFTYGEYPQITSARQAAIDRLIDGAARRGIAIVGWVVPRAVSYEDLACSIAAAAYRTPDGHGVRGLAVDLERGADFLGDSGGALADYIARLREALGERVLLVATVEDPYIERLSDADVPYAAIAASADVLQPMTYWRARAAGASIPGMRAVLRGSYALVRQLAGHRIPIDIGGQSANLGNRYAAPPPDEIAASFETARALGAIGETLFDWDGTSAAGWAAIAAAPWPPEARRSGRVPKTVSVVRRRKAGRHPVEVSGVWRVKRL